MKLLVAELLDIDLFFRILKFFVGELLDIDLFFRSSEIDSSRTVRYRSLFQVI